jgi:hypothetical protein
MLQRFAGEGLRTLCLAVRDLDDVFFNDWKHRHQEAALSLDNRDDKLDAIYEEIERDMTLIGELLVLKKELGISQNIEPGKQIGVTRTSDKLICHLVCFHMFVFGLRSLTGKIRFSCCYRLCES